MKCGKEVEADVKSDSFDKIINTANFASFNAYQEYLLEWKNVKTIKRI